MAELQVDLLHPPRGAHGPAAIAEMPLQLTNERPRCKSAELHTPFRLEAIKRLDERERGHLHQIVIGLAPIHEPARQLMREAQICFHDLVSYDGISGLGKGEERLLGDLSRAGSFHQL